MHVCPLNTHAVNINTVEAVLSGHPQGFRK